MTCSRLVDAVTGQCVPACPDGTRPRNGVCPGQDPAAPFGDSTWLSDTDCGCGSPASGIPTWAWWAAAGVGAVLLLGKSRRRKKR